MKEETKIVFNNMVEKMRMKGNKLKKFIFMDRETKAIWSVDNEETLDQFMDLYVEPDEIDKLHYYNNGTIISLHEV